MITLDTLTSGEPLGVVSYYCLRVQRCSWSWHNMVQPPSAWNVKSHLGTFFHQSPRHKEPQRTSATRQGVGTAGPFGAIRQQWHRHHDFANPWELPSPDFWRMTAMWIQPNPRTFVHDPIIIHFLLVPMLNTHHLLAYSMIPRCMIL